MPHQKIPPQSPAVASEMMETREVAAYLRLKERRVYDLVRRGTLPHIRATGKLLFPRRQIEAWLAAKSGIPNVTNANAAPPIIAGSHDPLLEWAARESRCGLAILACGSSAGLDRLARGEATVAALHWLDRVSGEYNLPLLRVAPSPDPIVAVEWAKRTQGLLLAPGNPLRIKTLADLRKKRARVAPRQPEAGSYRLFEHLLERAKVAPSSLDWLARPALTETDLAATIRMGQADAGVGIEAAARSHGLAFIPLAVERMDLALARRAYFEPAMQTLLAFARSGDFATQAKALGGYDVAATGRVVFNA